MSELEAESSEPAIKPSHVVTQTPVRLSVIQEEPSVNVTWVNKNVEPQPSTFAVKPIGNNPRIVSGVNRRSSTSKNVKRTGANSAKIEAKQGEGEGVSVDKRFRIDEYGNFRHINGGKRIRTRKYITKKKKRTRKLNKRLNKRLTKHKKLRVKKYTRRR